MRRFSILCVAFFCPAVWAQSAIEYWDGFEVEASTDATVIDVLSQKGIVRLLDETIADQAVRVDWDEANERVLVWVGGNALTDVVMVTTPVGRPTFEAQFDGAGHPLVRGYVAWDSVRNLAVVRFDLDLVRRNTYAADDADVATADPAAIAAAARTCKCYGLVGTATKACTDTECDTSVSCGTGNKICQWRAGTSMQNPGPG